MLRFYCHVFYVFELKKFLNIFIIKNFGINVTQNIILVISAVVYYVDLPLNHSIKVIDGQCGIVGLHTIIIVIITGIFKVA